MLADLFYLSTIWLVLSLCMLLWSGMRLHHDDFFLSLWYIVAVVGAGDFIALFWLGETFQLVAISSLIVFLLGFVFSGMVRDWNAIGRTFFLFSVITTVLYLLYAFAVTAF